MTPREGRRHPSATLGGAVLVAAAIAAGGCGVVNRGAQRTNRNDFGIVRCPDAAQNDLLSPDALQCWFAAPHGRWRTLSHESHYNVLVVQVEAADLRDANAITQRFQSSGMKTFAEILVYVQREPSAGPPLIRRVRWTKESGFETLTFAPSER
jgi:hypothetical protein